ncbi:MAG: dihydropteroate synthase [Formosimonas sp.]
MPHTLNSIKHPMPLWQCGRYTLSLTDLSRPYVMGILNITDDSFSDGGRFIEPAAALARAHAMIEAGADIIDIGAESTRPGATPLSVCQELCRLLPIVDALIDCGVPISIDTYKPYVMREMLQMGVDIINDVSGFQTPMALDAVADSDCGLCIMHMQGKPQTMQDAPEYADVLAEVLRFLQCRIECMRFIGIDTARVCVDPGIGFGKNLQHNMTLLNAIQQLHQHTRAAVLIGASRKRMIGELTGKPVDQRMAGSLATALFAAARGAHVLRVHDVAETVDALKVWSALSIESAQLR